jgi:outer membrane biosynthesis protein TonB
LVERARAARRKNQRTFALVAVSALLTGGLGAFLAARAFSHPPDPPGNTVEAAQADPTQAPAESTAQAAPPNGTATAAPTVTPTAEAPPVETAEPRPKPQKPVHTAAPQVARPKPAPTATAAPGSGVASGLKLKTD